MRNSISLKGTRLTSDILDREHQWFQWQGKIHPHCRHQSMLGWDQGHHILPTACYPPLVQTRDLVYRVVLTHCVLCPMISREYQQNGEHGYTPECCGDELALPLATVPEIIRVIILMSNCHVQNNLKDVRNWSYKIS